MAVSEQQARPRVSALKYIRDVRSEMAKVTWPTRKETLVTTAMVFVFCLIMAIFFLVVDFLASALIFQILKLGS